jgi:molybdopterin synthase sulfur carrier subunit
VRALYFAWVRERVGRSEEDLSPPPDVATVGELIAWLKTRDEGYALAFENAAVIRAAIDKSHARHETPIAGAREIAFFPPMTGG